MAAKSLASCLFCRIIKGEISSYKLLETDFSYSFMDIGPLSRGHALIIPKYHGEKLTDIPDEYLVDTLTIAKRIAVAQNVKDYNILQNNGRLAHQVVDHVHFHVIPKPNEKEGLGITWPAQEPEKAELQKISDEIKGRL